MRPIAALFSLTGRAFDGMPAVGGFNLTYLRDDASPAVLTTDEHRAPIVAAWQAGAGRVLAYATELDGELTGAIGQWPQVGDFYASLVRWTAGARQSLPADLLVTQQVENGVARISLQLDPERTSTPVGRLPRVSTLAGAPGGGVPSISRAEMTWRTPDELVAEVPLTGSSTYLSTVDVAGIGRVTLPPVTLPYSPELAPADAGEARAVLEKLARATGGVERITMEDVWRDLPRRARHVPLRMWLTLAAVALLLAEVAERRLRIAGERVLVTAGVRARRRVTKPAGAAPPVAADVPPPAPEPPPADAGETPALHDALQEAAKRARRRV